MIKLTHYSIFLFYCNSTSTTTTITTATYIFSCYFSTPPATTNMMCAIRNIHSLFWKSIINHIDCTPLCLSYQKKHTHIPKHTLLIIEKSLTFFFLKNVKMCLRRFRMCVCDVLLPSTLVVCWPNVFRFLLFLWLTKLLKPISWSVHPVIHSTINWSIQGAYTYFFCLFLCYNS